MGLTMRALARALDTGAMTLYNYVNQREELDLLVVEAVVAQVRWSLDEGQDWPDEVRVIATAIWRAVRAHPRAIPLILVRGRSRRCSGDRRCFVPWRGGRSERSLLIAFRAVFRS
jgi:hypothetical protein